jgi:hypothetical protein
MNQSALSFKIIAIAIWLPKVYKIRGKRKFPVLLQPIIQEDQK